MQQRGWSLLVISLLLVTPVIAEQVIVNSEDWRDVYSAMQYAGVQNLPVSFVINTEHGADLANRLGDDTDVFLITGRDQTMPGFRNLIQSKGYDVEELRSRNAFQTNQDLAIRANSKNLIIIDDGYGYNAISVATYANIRNSSVLFADPNIVDVIDDKNPDELLLFGHIPRDIFEDLEQYDSVIINEQDRFNDNFEIVKRFAQFAPREGFLLTNGDFIENQIIVDDIPVLFTGRQTVPDDVISFVRDNNFRLATLVGNALAPNALTIKEETGISIFIKFAQGRDSQQFSLDLFPLPIYNPLLQITQSEYDPTQQLLSITYENPGEIATYFSASFEGPDGTIEDAKPVFIEAGSHKTVQYDMTDPGDTLPYVILFGPSPNSLDLILQGSLTIERVTINDESEIDVIGARYETNANAFFVKIENTGPVDAFVLVEAVDVRIGGDDIRIAAPVTQIKPGEIIDIELPADLSEQDIRRNRDLSLEIFYGQRELSLIKFTRKTLAFDVIEGGFPLWAIGLAALVAIALAYFVVRKKKQKPHRPQYHPPQHQYYQQQQPPQQYYR